MATDTSAKGYLAPLGDDPVSLGDDRIRTLRDLLDLRPGVSIETTTTRDAIAGGNRWTGRTVYNTTRSIHEVWNGTTWVEAGGGGGFARSFVTMGA